MVTATELQQQIHQAQLQANLTQNQAQLADFQQQAMDELARRQKDAMDAAAYATLANGPQGIQGMRADYTIMDDWARQADPVEEYHKVAKYIRAVMGEIISAKNHIEEMKYERFKSPYHPWRAVRWLQKKGMRFWGWALALPVLLPIAAAIVYKLWDDTSSVFWTSILAYALIVCLGLCMKFIK